MPVLEADAPIVMSSKQQMLLFYWWVEDETEGDEKKIGSGSGLV
jgi:hypothetical protein